MLTTDESGICYECNMKLPIITGNRCVKCSKQIVVGETVYCSDCSKREFSYTQGYAMWHYNRLTKKIMSGIKYGKRRDYIEYISDELSYHSVKMINMWKPDVIIPVPLHPSRYRSRGFNQAELIAEYIGKTYGIPLASDVLYRTKKTKPQKYFDDKARENNLNNAFDVDRKKLTSYGNVKSALIVDDIYTTGSTIDACAEMLKIESIHDVYFLCVCIGEGY